jgi:hypothetical protein
MNPIHWEVGFVTYRKQGQKQRPIEYWLQSLFNYQLTIINNFPEAAIPPETQGHNQLQDLGAYSTLCNQFKGDGPYLIINDTLFSHHFSWAWQLFIKRWLKQQTEPLQSNTIWGDIRKPNNPPKLLPPEYLASWIFIIPNRTALLNFSTQLKLSLENTPLEFDLEYHAYLEKFINGNVFRGWHKIVDENEKTKKKNCYFVEHKLNWLLLETNTQLKPIYKSNSFFAFTIRNLERIHTRYLYISNYLQYLLQKVRLPS